MATTKTSSGRTARRAVGHPTRKTSERGSARGYRRSDPYALAEVIARRHIDWDLGRQSTGPARGHLPDPLLGPLRSRERFAPVHRPDPQGGRHRGTGTAEVHS